MLDLHANLEPIQGKVTYVIGYCRVSTEMQRDDGVSLSVQEERIRAWTTANGFHLHSIHIESASGYRLENRPELRQAIDTVRRLKGVLVVHSLSRLARNVKDTLFLADELQNRGANLASLSERIDTTTAVGKMVFRILSTLNEFERDQVSERTSAAMSFLRLQNRRISLNIPYGYKLEPSGNCITPDSIEQGYLREIMEMRGRCTSYRAIACRLNERGIPTKNFRSWHASTVHSIIRRANRLQVIGGP